MTALRTIAALLVLTATAACGGDAAPAATPGAQPKAEAKADTKARKTAPAEAKSVEARADEIIADLKKREQQQATGYEAATGRAPAPESSPSGQPRDAAYWRKEFAAAKTRLEASQKRLEDVRRRMSDAQQQAKSADAEIRKKGQAALELATQEYSRAQNAYFDDQSAVDRARSAAIRAGVPATEVR